MKAARERLGATFEGIHRRHGIVPGVGVRDSAWSSVIDAEWPAVRARLRERSTTRSRSDIVATSSTCSLMNHCMNCSLV